MTARLLTGATGFVGGAVALELLDRTDDPLVALVRGTDDPHATARLHDALGGMAVGYGRPDLVAAVQERTTAVAGDISLPGCGVGALAGIDEVWHCAASLQYEERHRAEIETHNVVGTGNVVALARQLGAGAINHVSTAYVAGNRRGVVPEEEATDVAATNNCYEETKVRAEALVRAAGDDMRVRILRPSVVIGHSGTRHGVNWSGLYGFVRQVRIFRKVGVRKLGTYLSHARVQMLGEPDSGLNLVPVDVVARNAVSIGLSDSPHTYFHLANSETITVSELVGEVMDQIGLREPRWVQDRDGFTALDEALDEGMGFYGSYLRGDKEFRLDHTDSVCGPDASRAPVDRDEMRAYIRYYLQQQPRTGELAPTARILHPVSV